MQQTLDTLHHYKGYGAGDAVCRLRVYEEPGKPTIVIVTELPENAGTSVTNRAERLATQVWQMLERPAEGMVWVEHYPESGRGRKVWEQEHFSLVTFSETMQGFRKPEWKALPKEEVEALVGQPLE